MGEPDAPTRLVLQAFRASDGYRFYYRTWVPPVRPRARLVILHGIRSHGGWYERSCQRFAAAGFEVSFLDRRGAGLNTARRGDCPSFRRLIDDVAEFLLKQRETAAWLPTFVAGISWGGKLAVGLQARRPGLTSGLILLCPGLKPQVSPPLASRLRIALARCARPEKFFPIPLNDPELFTSNPEWQQFIATDRYGLREATARFLFNSATFDIYLKRAASRVTVPTLLLLAGRDKVIDNARTRAYAASFPSRDNRAIDYPDAHHTLEFEGDRHPFMDDVVKWIERRI
ncbi:alpha/beta fold hydrolase [Fimbriiglobus ruber]|uniref:Lysophospholipase n=1 Tax=Fimbriiglobus ruber TaxID=1908690 RepID=A0A225E572_9BACT|nr:alpha/beta fold hydrolase [Fimbriiglobus ruber]OWK43825.1 Lysophospholipase [Fimbriiglobus ruber]